MCATANTARLNSRTRKKQSTVSNYQCGAAGDLDVDVGSYLSILLNMPKFEKSECKAQCDGFEECDIYLSTTPYSVP